MENKKDVSIITVKTKEGVKKYYINWNEWKADMDFFKERERLFRIKFFGF